MEDHELIDLTELKMSIKHEAGLEGGPTCQ